MSSKLQNSIWPNEGGTLGQIKVQIPTGTADDPWPTGDALVHNFVFNKGKLVGFVDTKALIANSSKTTTFPYEYVNISLPSIAEGEMTYNYDQCAYFILNGEVLKGDIPTNEDDVPSDEEVEIITKKYAGCLTVDDIKAVDPNYKTNDIINGVWKEGLGDLVNGNDMFSSTSALTSFYSDLSSLTDARAMFAGCTNLTTFSADLSSLTWGPNMFVVCKLDTASIKRIADTIKTLSSSSGPIHISIGNSTPNEEEKAAFNTMVSKGWTVYVGVNGGGTSPWTSTALIPIDGEETTTSIPYWAKSVPSDEEDAQYIDSEGNFYNIYGGNYIYGDNLENYGMFTSLEDAAANMRLTKIVK